MSVAAFKGIRKRYGSQVALDGLDLELPSGALIGLIGPNGAGKTTAFGVLGGFIQPDAGHVELFGNQAFDPKTHRGRLTVLPQDAELNRHTSVVDLLRFYGQLQGLDRRAARDEADRVLSLVRLSDRAGARIRELSHGMRRRVAVAQALLGDPELVLLDEPTSGLDPHLVIEMREILSSERGKRTLVVSSHVLADLEAICDHYIFMDHGKVVKAGSADAITGQRACIRVTVQGLLAPDAFSEFLPGRRLSLENQCVTIWADEGESIAALNAFALPALIRAGIGILEVERGRGLEQAYMATRQEPSS